MLTPVFQAMDWSSLNVLVGVGIGDDFGEYSRVCAHSCEHVFRTGTECERYRVHMKSL